MLPTDNYSKNQTVFEKVIIDWNTNHISMKNKIYPNMTCHFPRYVKAWQKNQCRQDDAVVSESNRCIQEVEHVTNSHNITMPAWNILATSNNNATYNLKAQMDNIGATTSPVTDDFIWVHWIFLQYM